MTAPNMTPAEVQLAFDIAAHELVIAGKKDTAEALRTAVAALIARVEELEADNKMLRGLLYDCVDHMEWSTPQGLAAYEAARAEAGHG